MTLQVAIRHRLGAFPLDIAFEAPQGVTALFGRSGAGKSTVIRAIGGLLRPEAGHIALDSTTLFDSAARVHVPVHRRRIGTVFQDGRLFPHLTVRQNLRYGAWFAGGGAAFADVVEMLGIGPLLTRRPATLSGGERQRVAIGRALLSSPRLLLMDEPLAALDAPRKAEILPYLERLRDEAAVPIVYVSHALSEVARLATTVVALADGKVERAGPAAEVLSDIAAFPLMGRQEASALLAARVIGDAGEGLTELAAGEGRLFVPGVAAAPGTELRLRVRARDVMIATEKPANISALNILPAEIAEIAEGGGPIVEIALTCGADRLIARITRRSLGALGLAPGKPCYAVLKSVAIGRRDIGGGG